jgi:(1->4)-alpha-D-glucan 1-alpha-D-glucosylmutase
MSEAGSGSREDLARLAAAAGIVPEYFDVDGKQHVTSVETQRALLAAMGIAVASDADAHAALAALEAREWRRILAPVAVVTANAAALALGLTLPRARTERSTRWTLTTENGRRWSGFVVPAELPELAAHRLDGVDFVRCRLTLPPLSSDLGCGYHRVELEADDAAQPAAMTLIVVPERCYEAPALSQGRAWGPTLQLYALRSRRNWGVGDFTDLQRVIELCAGAGADIVGLNPLHALSSVAPQRASPYSPSSRLFGNALYIDVEAVPEFAQCEAARHAVANADFQTRLQWLRGGELVGYRVSSAAKHGILELLYRDFRERHRGRGDDRERAFDAYLAAGGEALRRYALFEAIAERLHADGIAAAGDWRQWPASLRDVNGSAVAAFAAANAERVEFHAYLQWQFDAQLEAAGARAAALSLGVGLAQDLAVGIDPGGSERWSDPSLYAAGAHIGAPPDTYNAAGQDWGLPPPIPGRLRDAAYAPFVATLRQNMRAAGGLRFDHVMGLLRLYWVPAGATADAGAYVRYPFEDMLGILALESQRNRCMVIGEDLGTVPDEVREGLRRIGVLSSRPLYFQRDAAGAFEPPSAYPRAAAVSVGTHDLPTLKGFWVGADIEARAALSLFASPAQREAQERARTRERAMLLRALQDQGLLPQDVNPERAALGEWFPSIAPAVQRFLARTPAQIQLVAMEDVFEQREQVNLPGTIDEVPNWRRKLARDVEDWPDDPSFRALADALRAERGGARDG